MSEDADQNVELWRRELHAAGWHEYRGHHTMWVSPSGKLWRGPFGAWKAMKDGAR